MLLVTGNWTELRVGVSGSALEIVDRQVESRGERSRVESEGLVVARKLKHIIQSSEWRQESARQARKPESQSEMTSRKLHLGRVLSLSASQPYKLR